VTFGGRIDKAGYRLGRLDVTMSGRDMRLRFPEGMRSLVDADLTLQGTAESSVLSGLVTVKDAVYREAFTTTGSLFDFSQDQSLAPVASTPTTESLPVRLDVRVNAPSTLQIDNRTLRLVANADLQVRGTIERPVLLGRAEIERGEALFEGKRYLLTRGTVDFNNPNRIEPFLDIEAETRIRVPQETYQVTLRITGPLAQPNFTFNSDPPLGEVEILALVFSDVSPGRDAELRQFDQNTPQQRLFQERAARALTGVLSSEVSQVVEETFGVDTFQITPSLQDPNAQATSGLEPGLRLTVLKRLSERLYLTYSRSLSSSSRATQIILLEFDQTDRLSWILSRNEDGTYALDWRVRKIF
jgi:translocation and assembly module TamB